MKLSNTEFAGRPNNLHITHGLWEMVVTLDVGPRILSYGLVGEGNVFKVFEDHHGYHPNSKWLNYGGHRLWHAPEVLFRTAYPDNEPVEYDWDGDRLLLIPPEQTCNKLQLQMEISLDENEGARILHRVINTHTWEVELAAWAISVMAPGGRALLPQEPFVPHGQTYAPARPVVMWPYSDMSDPRYVWGQKFIQFRQDDAYPSKQKFGVLNTAGWAAYALNDTLFIKQFDNKPGLPYPDMGCNCEFYTMPGFLEIESLSPLTRLRPGAVLEHVENWSLHRADPGENEQTIEGVIIPLIRD